MVSGRESEGWDPKPFTSWQHLTLGCLKTINIPSLKVSQKNKIHVVVIYYNLFNCWLHNSNSIPLVGKAAFLLLSSFLYFIDKGVRLLIWSQVGRPRVVASQSCLHQICPASLNLSSWSLPCFSHIRTPRAAHSSLNLLSLPFTFEIAKFFHSPKFLAYKKGGNLDCRLQWVWGQSAG